MIQRWTDCQVAWKYSDALEAKDEEQAKGGE